MNASDFALNGVGATRAPAPTRTPTPEEAVSLAAKKAIEGKSIGDLLSQTEAAAVQRNWQGDEMAYKNLDGTFTLIARTKPLPDSAKADVDRRVSAAANEAKNSGDPLNATVNLAMKQIETDTGRNILFVSRIYTFVGPTYEYEGWTWVVPKIGDGRQYPSADTALAAAQGFLAAHADNNVGTEIMVVNR
jgi:hypothetical protein